MELDDIQIQVGNPQQRSEIGGVNKYFVYSLIGKDSKGEIAIIRRYSDFNLLREILLKRWPGCYIPSLPEKKTIGSSENIFVESRRRSLQIFLQTLAHSEAIWNSQQMQIFLKNSSGDTQKLLSPLLKQSFDRISTRYSQVFSDFNTGEVMKDAAAGISQFSSYLKDSKVFLDKLTEQTQKMYEVYHNNLQKKLTVLEFLLPDYQKNCLQYNDEKKNIEFLFIEAQKYEIKQKIDNYKKINQYPPILLVTEEIRRERRQIQAFEDAIKVKNQIQGLKIKATTRVNEFQIKQSKINAGKESIFSMIKLQSKQSQLAENKVAIEAAKAEEAMYAVVYQIVTNMIGTKEIYKFKQLRQKAYYKMLKTYAMLEKEMTVAQSDIWLATQNHDLVGLNELQNEPQNETNQSNQAKKPEQKQQVAKVQETQQQYQHLHEEEQITSDDI